MRGPENNPRWPYSYDLPRPFNLGIEVGVPQETPREGGKLILICVHHRNAIAAMTKVLPKETGVTRNELGASKCPQVSDNLFIFEAFREKIVADLPHSESGCFQQLPLPIEYVFVENDQARTRSNEYSAAAY